MHKFIVHYNFGQGFKEIYAKSMDLARGLALAEYRRNIGACTFGLDTYTSDQVIKSITQVD